MSYGVSFLSSLEKEYREILRRHFYVFLIYFLLWHNIYPCWMVRWSPSTRQLKPIGRHTKCVVGTGHQHSRRNTQPCDLFSFHVCSCRVSWQTLVCRFSVPMPPAGVVAGPLVPVRPRPGQHPPDLHWPQGHMSSESQRVCPRRKQVGHFAFYSFFVLSSWREKKLGNV